MEPAQKPQSASKVVPLHRGPAFHEDASTLLSDELLDSGEAIATRHLAERIQTLFDRADDTFFDLADKAESNTIQTLYFDAMRQLRMDRKDIEQRFIKGIHRHFDSNSNEGAQQPPPSLDQLSLDDISLIKDTDLEESLAIDGMVAKAQQRYSQPLYALEQRLHHLSPSRTLSIDTLPAGPHALCVAFRKALCHHDADLKIKLILYKLFDKHVMSALDDCYEDFNTFLIRAGVLPELKMQIRKVPGQTSSAHGAAMPSGDTASHTEGNFTSAGEGSTDFLATLQHLLAQAQGAHQPGIVSTGMAALGAPSGAIPTTGNDLAPTVLSALTGLQQQSVVAPVAEAGAEGNATLRTQLVTALGPEQAATLRQVDNDLIDIVSLLFDFILDDDNLPTAAKALLARLQIPMLKLAMLDRDFFSHKKHPARRLLNLMANACLGLDEGTADKAGVLDEVERVVNRILDEFTDEIGLFDTLLEEFSDWQAREAQREDVVPEPVSTRFRRREEIALAKQWVMASVAEHMAGKPVPDILHALITGPWTEVLLQTYLRHGEDDVLWLEQIRFIDILLWSVEPKQAPGDRRKLAGVIQSLVYTLRDGLDQAGCPQEDVQRIIDSLESYHMASLHGRRPGAPVPGSAPGGDTDTPSADTLQSTSEGDLDVLISNMQAQLADLDRIEALLDAEEPNRKPDNELNDEADNAPKNMNNPTTPDEDGETAHDAGANAGAATDPNAFDNDAVPAYIEDIVLSGPVGTQEAPETPIDDASLRVARELPVGAWLTFRTDSGETRRGRLAWKSDLLGQYTFVNWRYQVIADLSTQGLAAHLRRGSASPINDIPLFDRAMSALVNGLKRTPARTAP